MTESVVECSGAPRDVGYAQGRACRASLGQDFARGRSWERLRRRLGRLDGSEAILSRDLRRHFPHHAEALEGLARGAGVPFAHLVGQLARAGGTEGEAATSLAPEGGAPRLVRVAPRDAILRRTCPEPGFRSLELAFPGLTLALAGVNEKGLAGAVAHQPGALASLLLADCLLRFEALDAALDWCLARPAGGRAVVWLVDAGGETARVEFEGEQRRIRRGIPPLGLHAPGRLFTVDPRECRAALPDAGGLPRWHAV